MLSMEQYATNLGKVIRGRRLEADMTVLTLAEAVDLKEEELTAIEDGKVLPGTKRLIQIAQKLQTKPGSLFIEAEVVNMPDAVKRPVLHSLLIGDNIMGIMQAIQKVMDVKEPSQN